MSWPKCTLLRRGLRENPGFGAGWVPLDEDDRSLVGQAPARAEVVESRETPCLESLNPLTVTGNPLVSFAEHLLKDRSHFQREEIPNVTPCARSLPERSSLLPVGPAKGPGGRDRQGTVAARGPASEKV